MEPSEYGPFKKYALKHGLASEKVRFPYRLPLEIETEILSYLPRFSWWSLSLQHLIFFLAKKSPDDIMKRLAKTRRYDNENEGSRRLLVMRPHYLNSIDPNDLDDITRFKYYLYKYGYEVCIDGLNDMLHLFLSSEIITKEVLENAVRVLVDNNVELIPEFIVNCYFLGVKVDITPELASILIYNIWNRCNFIHNERTQKEILVCMNTMFDSIGFELDENDLKLIFLLFNMSGTIPPVCMLKRILNMLSKDPGEQLLISLQIPNTTNIPDTNYKGFPNKLSFGYIDCLVDPIEYISFEKLAQIFTALKALEKQHRYRLKYSTIESFVNNPAILSVMQSNVNDIDNPCIYSFVCDQFTEPIDNWNPGRYFEGCTENQKKINPEGLRVAFKSKLIDVDYTYIKHMSDQQLHDILFRPLNCVSIYGTRLIFDLGITRGAITEEEITDWVIRTYPDPSWLWLRTDEYGNIQLDVISDYMGIVKYCNNIPELIVVLSRDPYCAISDLLVEFGRLDLAYDITKYKLDEEYFTIPEIDELVDLILERQEEDMLDKLFSCDEWCGGVDKEYLNKRIRIYNSNHH